MFHFYLFHSNSIFIRQDPDFRIKRLSRVPPVVYLCRLDSLEIASSPRLLVRNRIIFWLIWKIIFLTQNYLWTPIWTVFRRCTWALCNSWSGRSAAWWHKPWYTGEETYYSNNRTHDIRNERCCGDWRRPPPIARNKRPVRSPTCWFERATNFSTLSPLALHCYHPFPQLTIPITSMPSP